MSLLLYIVARALLVCLSPVFIAYAIVKKVYQMLSSISLSLAVLIDTAGNVIGGEMMTDCLIKNKSIPFGSAETISYTLAKNDAVNNLSGAGIILKNILNFFDEDHLKKTLKRHQTNTPLT